MRIRNINSECIDHKCLFNPLNFFYISERTEQMRLENKLWQIINLNCCIGWNLWYCLCMFYFMWKFDYNIILVSNESYIYIYMYVCIYIYIYIYTYINSFLFLSGQMEGAPAMQKQKSNIILGKLIWIV